MHEYLKLEDKTLQNVHQFSFERAKIHVDYISYASF